jgi:hypothetical protein
MSFQIWKTVRIGARNYIDELEKEGYSLDRHVRSMLENLIHSATEAEVDLVRVGLEDLGFERYTYTVPLMQRAQDLGLELCPAEVGPALRLAYVDQPMAKGNTDWNNTFIGMKHVWIEGWGLPLIFWLTNNESEGVMLQAAGGSNCEWHSPANFVFVLPRRR